MSHLVSEPHYDVFLSSRFYDNGSLQTEVRPMTIQALERTGNTVWAWETNPDAQALDAEYGRNSVPPLLAISCFLAGLRRSKCVVLFISEGRGSRVHPFPNMADAYGTFLEIEVYFSLVFGKPIYLFREEGYSPEKPIMELLEIIRQSQGLAYEGFTKRSQLWSDASRTLARFPPNNRSRSGKFHTLLARQRDPSISSHTTMPFLYGASLPHADDIDLALTDSLINEGQNFSYSIMRRLSFLWLAIQGLLPYRNDMNPEISRRWQNALSAWAKAAAWLGIHTHLGVSPLVTFAEVARSIAKNETDTKSRSAMPYAGLASARYSVAKREAWGLRRMLEFDAVVAESRKILETNSADQGMLSILGNALMQKGKLIDARQVFDKSLQLRLKSGDTDAIGEGECDLGTALLLSGSILSGTTLLKEGVEKLRTRTEKGFYLRGLKRLELAYWLNGKPFDAARLRRTRHEIAANHDYFDQL